jgi:predicted metal-binding membrane protein
VAVDQQVESPQDAAPTLRSWPRDRLVAGALIALAALGWWWSARTADMDHAGSAMDDMGMSMSGEHVMSLASFLVGWVAMMAAMMLPAVVPVVALYRRAVEAGRAAPLPVFLLGYLLVWSVPGIPVYYAWRELQMPLADGEAWAGRVAAGALLAAAIWQLTPLKAVCLRHCRSPLSFFMQHGRGMKAPRRAFRLGLTHGGFCLGCCWLLMVVLVALGTMNLVWMAVLAGIIFIEKLAPRGEALVRVSALAFAVLGVYLLVDPTAVASFT